MHATNGHGAHPVLVCHGQRGPCVLWTSYSTHGPLLKICRAHIRTRLVGCWERGPLGCCENPSPLLGNSRENINIYILSYIYAYTHMHTRPLLHIVCTTHAAGGDNPHETYQAQEEYTQPALGPMQWQ